MNINKIRHIHFTGIKGVGLTSLALCAQDLGISISGSDVDEVFVTDEILKTRHLNYKTGFSPKNIPSALYDQPSSSLLIYTAAHNGPNNPEVKAAKNKGIKTLSHAEAVGLFMQGKIGISVCGVGGKTTIASMVAAILEKANLKPSFAIGVGNINSLGVPGKYNQHGKYFVTEADEYFAAPGVDDTPKFLYQHPEIIAVTNIEYDHPDVYESFTDTKKAYSKFFSNLPKEGIIVAFADNQNTLKLTKRSGKTLVTYGSHPRADFLLKSSIITENKQLVILMHKGVQQEYVLSIPGKFNAFNAMAAIAIATHLGIDHRTCSTALKKFTGSMRRFQVLGSTNGVTIVDDYAHHPGEIKVTLKAAKDWFPGQRIVAIFQPHTYSRTKALFSQFSQSFVDADEVILLPIYSSAREAIDPDISGKKLAEAVKKVHPSASYQENSADLLKYLKENSTQNDVIMTMGAGDISLLGKKLLTNL